MMFVLNGSCGVGCVAGVNMIGSLPLMSGYLCGHGRGVGSGIHTPEGIATGAQQGRAMGSGITDNLLCLHQRCTKVR